MSSDVQLTSEELELLTSINLAAHSFMRQEGKERDSISPCWLCCSDEAREEAVRGVTAYLNERVPGITTEEIAAAGSGEMLHAWIQVELELKQLRAKGNPRAFFSE